jgi:hypothetical protein
MVTDLGREIITYGGFTDTGCKLTILSVITSRVRIYRGPWSLDSSLSYRDSHFDYFPGAIMDNLSRCMPAFRISRLPGQGFKAMTGNKVEVTGTTFKK